jgi:hypothetical protein
MKYLYVKNKQKQRKTFVLVFFVVLHQAVIWSAIWEKWLERAATEKVSKCFTYKN